MKFRTVFPPKISVQIVNEHICFNRFKVNDWQNLRAFSEGTAVVTDDSEMGLYFLGVLDSSL